MEEIKTELNDIQRDVTSLKVDMSTVKIDLATLKDDVKDVKEQAKAQIWALIIAIIGAIVTTFVHFGFLFQSLGFEILLNTPDSGGN